jgi:hypothetical protein
MNKLEPFGIFDQPLSEDHDGEGPSKRADEHEGGNLLPGYAQDGKPLPYTGILRKPLPPSGSPEHDREFQRRYEALCNHFGVDPRDHMGLLACLMFRHVPGFRPSTPDPSFDESHPYADLAKALLGIGMRGRPGKPAYEVILPIAIRYYKQKKSENPRLSQVKICEMFLEKEQKRIRKDFPDSYEWFRGLNAQTLARKVREALKAESAT